MDHKVMVNVWKTKADRNVDLKKPDISNPHHSSPVLYGIQGKDNQAAKTLLSISNEYNSTICRHISEFKRQLEEGQKSRISTSKNKLLYRFLMS